MKKELRTGGGMLSIKRTPTEQVEQEQPATKAPVTSSSTGGIHLASAPTETDPFRKSLTDAGYIILDENEYGCLCRFKQGKPTFIPKTNQEFNPNEKEVRMTVLLPEHLNTAVKVNTARLRISTTQYVMQLILADLRKNGDI